MKPSRSVPIGYVLPNWLRVPVQPIFVATEIRAVFPAWLFAMLVVAMASLLDGWLSQSAVFLGYGLGCTAIGSIAVGHDFMHRTLGTTLSLPSPRERLWWTRLMVLLVSMVPLAALAGVQLLRFSHISIRDLTGSGVAIFVIPMLGGLFVAPCVTLLCRSPLAGTVFTACLPGLLWMLSELAVTARFADDPSV